MGEAALLGLFGVVAGSIMAMIGMRALMLSPTSRGFIEPTLPPSAFAIAAAMGAILCVLGEGEVRVNSDGSWRSAQIDGGFLSVDSDVVTIVAENVDASALTSSER